MQDSKLRLDGIRLGLVGWLMGLDGVKCDHMELDGPDGIR